MTTSTSLRTFNYLTNAIRVVDIDGKPWFVAADVCRALGLLNASRATSPLGEHEKGLQVLNTPGGQQSMTVIAESGLYKLVLRAHRSNPAAAEFQDWVTRDVLPAIRKDGAYVMGEEKVVSGEMNEDERAVSDRGLDRSG
ncbi:MAG: BRO domain-containing protein [Hyphomicrobiales bacterium]|nr:MAG: BRO domain-containing protein [Hyphomicrobiales bacterium]